ncbi:DNA polymerase delta catalytic subunit [Hondaea fermentalgiana]|uniref:DNA polymerase delta catalytic subunit n=1 Tax=Hondaea fermentalgiana TaxID=2315210 RepID=A0A2R5GMQ6_9STRA|nr:DNA polymerase delta catalytic subunit [Hondaea fermentalgiana]|eukprot:GBG29591.1 DNA polymerase delta catalytic subunit [Hondaea fermentalgiana]
MDKLLSDAADVGVECKIDPDESDSSYLAAWRRIVDQLLEAKAYLPTKKTKGPATLDDAPDAAEYRDERHAWDAFVEELDEQTDVSLYLGPLCERAEARRCAVPRESPAAAAGPASGTAFVSDVQWENRPEGALVFLYARDAAERERTLLLTIPMDDYFYVQVDFPGGPGASSARRLIYEAAKGIYDQLRRNPSEPSSPWTEARCEGRLAPSGQDERLLLGCKSLLREIKLETHLRSVYGFQREPGAFLRVGTASPTVTRKIFYALQRRKPFVWRFFETSSDPLVKWMVRTGVKGCAAVRWLGVSTTDNPLSACDFWVKASAVEPLGGPDAPLYVPRNMYFDIECLSDDPDSFPTSDRCPVFQISYVVSEGTDKVLESGVLCLRETAGYTSFATEQQLLLAFAQLLRKFRPDVLQGYNSNNFDLPYILDRMDAAGVPFARELSRRKRFRVQYQRKTSESRQAGASDVTSFLTPGLTLLDQFAVLKGDVTLRLRSYSLKAVCEHFFRGQENKEDLRYRDIPGLFASGSEGRAKIASYCLQDSALLRRLDGVAMLGLRTAGMAQVLGTSATVVLTRGLVFRTSGLIMLYAHEGSLLIPSFTKETRPHVETGFQGAFVVDPRVGFYKDAIAVLDAASLYPSCIMSFNLSFDTISLDAADRKKHPGDFVEYDGEHFVKKQVREGILVRLQADLAAARKAAKKRRDAFEPGSDGYNAYESTQLAVKVTMNSIYGALGSPTSDVPLVQIAKTITARGRFMLNMFSEFVKDRYQGVTGEEVPAQIVYGDSVRGDMPVVVRRARDTVHVVAIEDLLLLLPEGQRRDMRADKEAYDLSDSPVLLESWTEDGWTPITAFISHLHHAPLVRVDTPCSSVVVTQHHSLLDADAEPLEPAAIKVGASRLLHARFPSGGGGSEERLPGPETCVPDSTRLPTDLPLDRETAELAALMVAFSAWEDDEGPEVAPCSPTGNGGSWERREAWEHRERIEGRRRALVLRQMPLRVARRARALLRKLYPELREPGVRTWLGAATLDTVSASRVDLTVRDATPEFMLEWEAFVFCPYTRKRCVSATMLSAPDSRARCYFASLLLKHYPKISEDRLVMQGVFYIMDGRDVPPGSGFHEDLADSTVASVKRMPRSMQPVRVYDLTTGNHHFQAGVGNMIVHNTDSIFIRMPGVDVPRAIENGLALEKAFSKEKLQDLAPQKFEYEKVYLPLILLGKKRYAGLKFELDPNKGKFSASGIQLVRRDTAMLCVDVMKGFFDRFIVQNNEKAALEFVRQTTRDMYEGKLPLAAFEITRKIAKVHYKVEPPHITAWKAMAKQLNNNPDRVPSVGERFAYVVTKPDPRGRFRFKANGLSEAIIGMEIAKEDKRISLDYNYYHRTFVESPLRQIIELSFGKEVANDVLDPRKYRQIVVTHATKHNLLGHFGISSISTAKRQKKD